MYNQIKLNKNVYGKVKEYFDNEYDLNKESNVMGLVYKLKEGDASEVICLQERKDNLGISDSSYFVVISDKHPDYERVKKDLEEISKDN